LKQEFYGPFFEEVEYTFIAGFYAVSFMCSLHFSGAGFFYCRKGIFILEMVQAVSIFFNGPVP
jgi:hypothetical protein